MKNKNKILCVMLLLSLMLSLLVPFTAYAETSYQSYDDTPIEEDLANMGEFKYPENSLGDCSVISFMEYCYSNDEAYSAYYGLYVYVYNPTCKVIMTREGANEISISNAFASDGTASSLKDYKLTFLDCTDDFLFYKFKLTDPEEQYLLMKEYTERWNDKRRYEVGSIDILFSGETGQKAFPASRIYEYTGFAKSCDESSMSESTLKCQYYGGNEIHLQVYDTNYRFAHKGNNLYDDLQSVYFSIPNEYYEKFGDLTKITAEWYQYKTSPMFVTTDLDAYSALFDMRNIRINEFGQLIDENGKILDSSVQSYWRVYWDEYPYIAEMPTELTIYKFNKAYNAKCRDDIDDDGFFEGVFNPSDKSSFYSLGDNWSSISKLDWIFPITQEIESLDDYRVSSEEVKKYMEKYTTTFRTQEKILGKYAADLFERYNGDGYQYNSFEITDAKQYIDKNDNQSFWEKLWGINNTDEYPYSPIVTISEADLILTNDNFAEKYLVNKEDSSAIKEFARNSYKNGEKPILLRFAKTDYYASKARFDYAEADAFNISDVDGYVAQEYVFLNFDVLSLEYTAKDGFTKTLVACVNEPIDIINGLTPPDDMPVPEDEWWKQILSIILFVVVVIVILNLTSFVKPIIDVIIQGFVGAVSLVIDILTLPFRLIFGNRRK